MKKKIAYFFLFAALLSGFYYCLGTSRYKVPLEFDPYSGCPIVSLQIEEKKYPLELDLGSKISLSLQNRVLKKIKKTQDGTSRRLDYQGNRYETPCYLIPKASLHTFSASKIRAQEESYSFLNSSLLYSNTGRKAEEIAYSYFGRLGLDFFSHHNFLIDCQNAHLILCKKIEDLRGDGYKIENFAVGSFTLSPGGILLNIDTDLGALKMILDTGSTHTFIRSSLLDGKNYSMSHLNIPMLHTSKFVLNGIHCGPFDLYSMNIPASFAFTDGLLGMDFLKHHALFFDFETQCVYILRKPKLPPA